MKRLLLISQRPLSQEGGPTARWRAFSRYLPEHGWEVHVVSAPPRASGVEFASDAGAAKRVARRARLMAVLGRAAAPLFRAAGLRPEAAPLSMLWLVNGTMAVRARVRELQPDVVLATAPPAVALLVAARALPKDGPPLATELRDLWAGNPAFETRPGVLGRLESGAFNRSARVVVMSPEAAADVRARHPAVAARVIEIPNGFEPSLLELRTETPRVPGEPVALLHSGTLVGSRPLRPLLDVLAAEEYRGRFRLLLHGYLSPASRAELAAAAPAEVEVLPPSTWEEAVERMCRADVCLVTQSTLAGDQTAIASKVFEYLALGKPVLSLTDGGATEALLRRLGAGGLIARLNDRSSITAALDRVLLGEDWPAPVPPAALAAYDYRCLARRMANVLDTVLGEEG